MESPSVSRVDFFFLKFGKGQISIEQSFRSWIAPASQGKIFKVRSKTLTSLQKKRIGLYKMSSGSWQISEQQYQQPSII